MLDRARDSSRPARESVCIRAEGRIFSFFFKNRGSFFLRIENQVESSRAEFCARVYYVFFFFNKKIYIHTHTRARQSDRGGGRLRVRVFRWGGEAKDRDPKRIKPNNQMMISLRINKEN